MKLLSLALTSTFIFLDWLRDESFILNPFFFGRGVRPTRLFELHAPGQSPF